MKYQKTKKSSHLEGNISISPKGTGYVPLDTKSKKGEDIEIDFKHLRGALNGDRVEILLHPKREGRRQTGEVIRVLLRAKKGFVGILQKNKEVYTLKPNDTKMYIDILIPKNALHNAKAGEKVFAEIINWPDHTKMPEGKIVEILGKPGNNDTEMRSIAIEKGFASKLPEKIEKEAEKIKHLGITPKDLEGRRDFRKTLTFTIDPADAKDFDDAISFKEINGNKFEVGIHIADVTHYLKKDGPIDLEARERATSVYLVDRTIPMLPEVLSNDLCSLVPDKDRLTMSAVFEIDTDGVVHGEWYGRTIIHSQKRFTYEEAEKTIHSTQLPLHNELSILNKIAKKLTVERFKKGAISLDQEEVKFVLDKNGVPIKVVKKERGDSNKLIEEFMLLANKKVAELLSKDLHKKVKTPDLSGIFLYRIHDTPSKEKMEDLAFFLRSLGYKIKMENGVIPNEELNSLLKKLEGKNEKDTVHRAIVRSMAKAIYSTQNIGHYGLAFDYYTHFTSPIRRYPDIVVHRLLIEYLSKRKIKIEDYKEYEQISLSSSIQEKKAQDAERASIKYKQVEYMSTRIGSKFNGIISGISEWGVFVEDKETKSEGLIRMRDLEDDFYTFNEKHMEIVGKNRKNRYRLGDKIKIKVKSVDLEKKTIDYVLVK